MQTVQYLEIKEQDVQRLDNYLIRMLKGVPKSHIYRMIREGQVRLNKKRVKPAMRLQVGDMVRIPPIRMSAPETFMPKQLGRTLSDCILYEDADLLVLNKPAGLAVHGGSGVQAGVIEALRASRSDLSYLELAHRLDKATSGCLVLAKKKSVLSLLQAQFEKRSIKKTYWALLHGRWQGKQKCYVDAPLLKNTLASGERLVRISPEGKVSKTRFILLANADECCFVEASPKTGRTHQIRVHSASLGHPIVGDEKYILKRLIGRDIAPPKRLYLHARSIHFMIKARQYQFTAELDERFSHVLKELRLQ